MSGYVLDESWRVASPTCAQCAHHVRGQGVRECAAFPSGIPKVIWNGQNDHRSPFPGDHGIQFRELTAEERAIVIAELDKILEERRLEYNRRRKEQGLPLIPERKEERDSR